MAAKLLRGQGGTEVRNLEAATLGHLVVDKGTRTQQTQEGWKEGHRKLGAAQAVCHGEGG